MVATNNVCNRDKPTEERSPSPEPFREPEFMYTIDLNSETNEATNPTPNENFKRGRITKILLFVCGITLLCLTSLLVAVAASEGIFTTGPISHVNVESNVVKSLSRNPILNEELARDYNEELALCKITQTLEDCCNILVESTEGEMLSVCAVNEVLSFILDFENEEREKRQTDNENKEAINKRILESKFQSYVDKLHKPLRQKIPMLYDVINDFFHPKDFLHVESSPVLVEELDGNDDGSGSESLNSFLDSGDHENLNNVSNNIDTVTSDILSVHNFQTTEEHDQFLDSINLLVDSDDHEITGKGVDQDKKMKRAALIWNEPPASDITTIDYSDPNERYDPTDTVTNNLEANMLLNTNEALHMQNNYVDYAQDGNGGEQNHNLNSMQGYGDNALLQTYHMAQYPQIETTINGNTNQNNDLPGFTVELPNNFEGNMFSNVAELSREYNMNPEYIPTNPGNDYNSDTYLSLNEDYVFPKNMQNDLYTQSGNSDRYSRPNYEHPGSFPAFDIEVPINTFSEDFERSHTPNDNTQYVGTGNGNEYVSNPDSSQGYLFEQNIYNEKHQYSNSGNQKTDKHALNRNAESKQYGYPILSNPEKTRTNIFDIGGESKSQSRNNPLDEKSSLDSTGNRASVSSIEQSYSDSMYKKYFNPAESNLQNFNDTSSQHPMMQLPPEENFQNSNSTLQMSYVETQVGSANGNLIQNTQLEDTSPGDPEETVPKKYTVPIWIDEDHQLNFNYSKQYRNNMDNSFYRPTETTLTIPMSYASGDRIQKSNGSLHGNISNTADAGNPYVFLGRAITTEKDLEDVTIDNNYIQEQTSTVLPKVCPDGDCPEVFVTTSTISKIDNITADGTNFSFSVNNTRIKLSKGNNSRDQKTGSENDKNQPPSVRATYVEFNPEDRETLASDPNGKNKVGMFSTVSENLQTSQHAMVNPCFYQYQSLYPGPYRVASPYDQSQILNIVPMNSQKLQQQQQPVYLVNPPVYSYVPTSSVVSNYGAAQHQINPYGLVSEIPNLNNQNGPIQVTGSGGQYYVCNPISTPSNTNVANMPGVEVRRDSEVSNMQDQMDNVVLETKPSNKAREALRCAFGEQSCFDGSKCVNARHICDNEIHCNDGSDEMFCSCRNRIGEVRICDGYLDCPNGEDEIGCFGCEENEISCDDWSRFRKGTCVPIEQRCDGIRHCEVTGKDEEDCSILIDHVGVEKLFKVSNAIGFLHRNYKGKWYPSCFGNELWAVDVCKIEAGPSSITPKSHMVLTSSKYDGAFINILPNREVSIVNTCMQDRAAFVECPPLFCGLRMTVRNPYRQLEVDTDIEEIYNHLNRGNEDYPDEFVDSINYKYNDSQNLVGNSRVVGGKASQPGAWPWVVSIYKNGIFHCGGVIISDLWIITAAHCVDKFWQYYYEVQAGVLRRFSYSPMEQNRWATMAIPHVSYDKSNLKNDIALMRLSSPVRYNRYVRPICLPSEATAGRDFLRGPLPGTICTAVGWGATVEHGADPDHMREVELPVLKHCKHLEDEQGHELCAGLLEGGKDACQGDSGGPFMCQNPNNPMQWYLAGIVSHGEGCARPNEPGVYTRVSEYVGWIAENTDDSKFVSRVPLQVCTGFTCKGSNRCLPKKRRCDKIVDCLMGDDEFNCANTFNDIFKHAFRPNVFRAADEDTLNPDNILKAFIINYDQLANKTEQGYNVTENVTPNINTDGKSTSESTNTYKVKYKYERILNSSKNDAFRCRKMLQVIPASKRCNKILDCEDGTDEEGCLCVDYLGHTHTHAICDGLVDCADLSDELNCAKCNNDEFNCRRSQMCIPLSARCDGNMDCDEKEDEWDCVTLTNGNTLTLDSDLRPDLSMSGIITINRLGVWRPFCNNVSDKAATVATNVCNLLGFEEYTGFHTVPVINRSLHTTVTRFEKANKYDSSLEKKNDNGTVKCKGLYIWCSNVTLNNKVFNAHQEQNNEEINGEVYASPWNAVIYSDGKYRCMGAILDANWIVTSINCSRDLMILRSHYVAIVLGKGIRNLGVGGPHEQTIRVMQSVNVGTSDIIMLRLESPISFNRYVQPTHIRARIDGSRSERCTAVGLENGETKLVFLRSNKTCSKELKCYTRIQSFEVNCTSRETWSGTIVCNSGNGWYPAAVFQEKEGFCGFSQRTQYTNIRSLTSEILRIAHQIAMIVAPPNCNGFRCNLGQCIEEKKICDGISNCRSGEDEEFKFCQDRYRSCNLTGSCPCRQDQFKCPNGKCIAKSSFCDKIDDCEDFSDEPAVCNCRTYMQLAHPDKICDGIVHCFDRSDEDSKICPCRLDSFKCGQLNECVSNDMICDGVEDCPQGEDEKLCYSLKANLTNPYYGEVFSRTAGIWHKSCFTENLSPSDVDDFCHMIGFKGGHTSKIITSNQSSTSMIPLLDIFNVVWIRESKKDKLKYRFRTGNDPYVHFEEKVGCHNLYIECF